MNVIEQYDVVMISYYQDLLDELKNKNIKVILVFPEKMCKEEYIQRYWIRGNSPQYLEIRKEKFDSQVDFLEKREEEKWILKQGEYLEDCLIKKSILKRKRK